MYLGARDDLGGGVLWRPAECLQKVGIVVHVAKAKIDKLDFIAVIQQDIFCADRQQNHKKTCTRTWLEVAMDDKVLVAIVDGGQNRAENGPKFLLGKVAVLCNIRQKLSFPHALHHHHKVLAGLDHLVHCDNVWVMQQRKQAHLSHQPFHRLSNRRRLCHKL